MFEQDQAIRKINDVIADFVRQSDSDSSAGIRNPVFEIWSPRIGFRHSVALGLARADNNSPMTPDHQFHIASVGKTMTAVLILQLWEEGVLGDKGLDVPLPELDVFHPAVIQKLHVIDGVSHGARITLRQLLNHSSGLKDAHVDGAEGIAADYGGPAPDALLFEFINGVKAIGEGKTGRETNGAFRRWAPWNAAKPDDARAGVLNYYLNNMAFSPVGPPGEQFHYSDTAYIILGLVIEKLTGRSFHLQLRERIFDPLGLNHTYLHGSSNPDYHNWEAEVADFYLGPVPAVSSGVDLSFDWSGGGEVSTAHELNLLMHGLLSGDLFQQAETLQEMTEWLCLPGLDAPHTGVGLGLFRNKYPGGTEVWGHSGAWGAAMFYEPISDTYLAGSLNQIFNAPPGWVEKIFMAMRTH